MNNQLQATDERSLLASIFATLMRRWWVVLACIVVVPAAALAHALSQPKEYTASASLLFRDPQLDQKLFRATVFAPSSDPAREAATNVKLVSLAVVAARTSKALGSKLSVDDIQSKVNVAPEGQSDVASISALDHNPAFAARLANTFAQQFITFRRDADRSKIDSAQKLVQQQLSRLPLDQRSGVQGRSLRSQAEQLQILAALQTGNAELVQPAEVPKTATSPRPTRDTIVGFVLGILLGIGLAALLERADRNLRDPREIALAFDRPILGVVPESRTIAKAGAGLQRLESAEEEAFRMLRANLRYFNVDRQIKSVLITSAAPGEGKSTVALQLAMVAAGSGSRVLLLEADLRRPVLAARLALRGREGLSQVLAGSLDLNDAVKEIALEGPVTARLDDPRVLDVLVAGPIPPNPSDLVESGRMRELITHAESVYDLVVIDTPPTSVVSDAIPLVSEVSGVIVVARVGHTKRESANHLHNQLENLRANTLGVVVNSVGRRQTGYGYGYGYGYGDSDGAYTTRPSGVGRKRRAAEEPARRASEPEVYREGDPAAGSRSVVATGELSGRARNGTAHSSGNGDESNPRDESTGDIEGSQPKGLRGRLRRFLDEDQY
ncbi:MAG: tyrosine-protein kinase [Thermoleophilaceae bacterium]|jgi:receptor protein-tyrosine kinase|nr:tyrosine-protein kinase [Thermoleophilaceae bacterium]